MLLGPKFALFTLFAAVVLIIIGNFKPVDYKKSIKKAKFQV